MLLVPGFGYRTSFLFSNVLIDPQRTSFGDKNSDRLAQAGPPPRLLGRLPYWEQKSEREKEREREGRERERGRGRAEERKKGKTWHSSVKSASFVCFLGLSFRKENRPGVQKTQNFLVFKLRRLFKSLGLFESVGTYNDV